MRIPSQAEIFAFIERNPIRNAILGLVAVVALVATVRSLDTDRTAVKKPQSTSVSNLAIAATVREIERGEPAKEKEGQHLGVTSWPEVTPDIKKALEKNPPARTPTLLILSAIAAPQDETTREAQAIRLLHKGTLKDWVVARPEIRRLMCVYYAARFTPEGDRVDTFDRADSYYDYLNEISITQNGEISEYLSLCLAIHLEMEHLVPRK